jgi:hypothetical protein
MVYWGMRNNNTVQLTKMKKIILIFSLLCIGFVGKSQVLTVSKKGVTWSGTNFTASPFVGFIFGQSNANLTLYGTNSSTTFSLANVTTFQVNGVTVSNNFITIRDSLDKYVNFNDVLSSTDTGVGRRLDTTNARLARKIDTTNAVLKRIEAQDSTTLSRKLVNVGNLISDSVFMKQTRDSIATNNALARRSIDSLAAINAKLSRQLDSLNAITIQLRKANDTLSAIKNFARVDTVQGFISGIKADTLNARTLRMLDSITQQLAVLKAIRIVDSLQNPILSDFENSNIARPVGGYNDNNQFRSISVYKTNDVALPEEIRAMPLVALRADGTVASLRTTSVGALVVSVENEGERIATDNAATQSQVGTQAADTLNMIGLFNNTNGNTAYMQSDGTNALTKDANIANLTRTQSQAGLGSNLTIGGHDLQNNATKAIAIAPSGAVLTSGRYNSTPPTTTAGNLQELQIDVNGNLKTVLQAGNNTIGNTNQTLATAEFAKITDGTNTMAVKAASTPAVAADPSAVMQLSPNGNQSTSALQTAGNTSLSSIDTKLANNATTTLQAAGNTSLSNIDTKTPALGQALAAASTPVVLPVAQITALTPPAAITGFALESTQLTGNTAITNLNKTTAALPFSNRLSDGTAFYTALSDAQLRATPISNNITQINGTAITVGAGSTTANTPRFTLPTDYVGQNASQGATSTNAYLRYRNTALSNTVQTVKATAGNIYGLRIINSDASQVIYVKMYDAATVTVGTTAAIETIPIAANSVYEITPSALPFQFFQTNSIKIVCVTGVADASTTAPTTPCLIEIKYN